MYHAFGLTILMGVLIIHASCELGVGSSPDNIPENSVETSSSNPFGNEAENFALPPKSWSFSGATYYLDPVHGSIDGDGSRENPFPSLEAVLENNLIEFYSYADYENNPNEMVMRNPGSPIQGGDLLILQEGYHGVVDTRNFYPEDFLTIRGESNENSRLGYVRLRGSGSLIFENLSISPSYLDSYTRTTPFALVEHSSHGDIHHIALKNSNIFSQPDSSSWTIEDWNSIPATGLSGGGYALIFENIHIRNIDAGISVGGEKIVVRENIIENFAADGLRGNGNHMLFEGNLVMNCYDVNSNHDDGFQSVSSPDAPHHHVTLRGNTILNFTSENQPFRGSLQGIGMFDGFYDQWVIENNLVVCDVYHGIAVKGSRELILRNNTVVDAIPGNSATPWILVDAHKDGTASRSITIVNNLLPYFSGNPEENGYFLDANYSYLDEDPFIDRAAGNYRVQNNSNITDQGNEDWAPPEDIEGRSRPRGAGVDIGAFEG